jgi:hypothetical protein
MWNREQLEQRMAAAGLKGKCWGRFGNAAVEDIEATLKAALPTELRSFGEHVGNVIVGPFSVIVCGSDDRKLNCATETLKMRTGNNRQSHKLIKIMDHAGESYFAASDTEEIRCYDTLNVTEGMEMT